MKALGSGDELLLPTIKSEPGVHSPCEKDMVPSGSSQSNSLFSTIASSNKRPRTDDWLNPTSPGPPMGAAPLTPSPGPHNQYTVISNGYSSPMSSGSYDPYSPNGKLGKFFLFPSPPALNPGEETDVDGLLPRDVNFINAPYNRILEKEEKKEDERKC